MKIYLFFILLLCSSYDVLAQNVTENSQKREVQYGVEYTNYWRHDAVCDTLFLEDGTFSFLLRTPIRYIPGYTALFKEADNLYDSEVVFTTSSDLGNYGYTISWQMKDRKLYVARIYWNQIEITGPDRNGVVGAWKGAYVAPTEIRRRFEKLTGRKFNEDGLMLANWVTDAIKVVKYHPYMPLNKKQSHYRQFLERHQRTMELGLNKGELWEVNEIVPKKIDSLSSPFHEEYRPTCALPEPKVAMDVLMDQINRQAYEDTTDEYRRSAASYLYTQWERLNLASTTGYTMVDAYRICKVDGYYIE